MTRPARSIPIKQPWHESEVIGAKADYASPLTPRQSGRYFGELEPSRPPFKPSIVRNLIGAIISAVVA